MTDELGPIYVLDLDEDFLSHLAIPESWMVIQAEGVDQRILNDDAVISVYEWQKDHQRVDGKPASASVLAEEFDLDLQPPETTIRDCIQRLRDRYLKNKGKTVLAGVVKGHGHDPLLLPELLMRAGRDLASITGRKGETFGTGDMARAMYLYDKKVNLGPGSSLGFDELNDHFYGQRGLTYVVAPPKTYKSWFMLCVLADNVRNGKMTTLFSLELPTNETYMRLQHFLADIPFWRFLKNQIGHDDRIRLEQAAELIDSSGTFRIHKPPQGERSIDHLVDSARNEGADLILIDQLQYVEVDGKSLGELNNTGSYWGALDRARNYSDDGPIMIAHQFNRQSMYAEEMPDVRHAKGSSAIEETATLAIGLWANKDMRRSGLVEVGTLISRNYMYASWEMGIELGRGCSFSILRRVEEDEE